MNHLSPASQIEILAPAGSMEALVAAVRSGADAVYFGADNFNARRNAANFSGTALKNAIHYCRRFNVRCYLALNTLISERELSGALQLAAQAARFGINGVIIQDLGLAVLLHRKLPQLALHASTQMTVHSPAALKPLKRLGFKRVVAAREMSEKELHTLCTAAEKLHMEVEVFIHGALCMSISGQCYFSAFLGGRSANRGLCAGTCRLPFSCKGAQNVLSLKDLSLIRYLNRLQSMGVASAKIEGRMKRPEYVAAAVHCAVTARENGQPTPQDEQLLREVFSRSGFTDGYFTEKRDGTMFGARTKEDAVPPKTLKMLHALYRHDPQRVGITARLTLQPGASVLQLSCGSHCVTVNGPAPEPAVQLSLSAEKAQMLLSRLGGTPYSLTEFSLKSTPGLTLSAAAVNAMKQQAVMQLDLLRTKDIALPENPVCYQPISMPRKIGSFFLRLSTPAQLPTNLSQVSGISFPAMQIMKGLPPALPKSLIWAELPRTSFEESALKTLLQQLKELGIQKTVAGNLATVSLALEQGFQVMGGFGLNLYNRMAAEYFKLLGLKGAVLSPELSANQLPEVTAAADDNFYLLAFCYGYFPLMLVRNCPMKGHVGCQKSNCILSDRRGEQFSLSCQHETTELYNNRPIMMSDRLSTISADIGYLYFTKETKKETDDILTLYRQQKMPTGNYTRGLFSSGVL